MNGLSMRVRDRRALIVGLAIVGPILLFQGAIAPYARALGQVREQIEVERNLLRRERAMIAEAPRYPELVEQAVSLLQARRDRLFSGPEPLSAAAALVNYVGQAAREHRVLVQQSETEDADPAGPGIVTLQISVRGVSDLEGLLGFLKALEQGPKLVRVQEISIEQPQRLIRPRRDEETLAFRAVLTGYGLSRVEAPAGVPDLVTIGGDR